MHTTREKERERERERALERFSREKERKRLRFSSPGNWDTDPPHHVVAGADELDSGSRSAL